MNTIEKQNLLMKKWKQEHINKGYINFISDGILNYELWEKSNLKICFFLKEAYGDFGSLPNHFQSWGKVKYQLWHNVSYWSYGINYVFKENNIPDFDECKSDSEEHYKLLQSVSIVNQFQQCFEKQRIILNVFDDLKINLKAIFLDRVLLCFLRLECQNLSLNSI